eukprot:Gb_12261 [translate_table: standard]
MVAESASSPAPERHRHGTISSPRHPSQSHLQQQQQHQHEQSRLNPSHRALRNGVNGGEPQQQQQLRRSRSREVSSRYMFPTASSAAAAVSINSPNYADAAAASSPARRSSSPNPVRKGTKNSSDSSTACNGTRSTSAERRRSPKAEENGESTKSAVDSVRLRGSTGLWPSSTTNNNLPTLAEQLGNDRLKKIAENDLLGKRDNSNSHSNSNGLQKMKDQSTTFRDSNTNAGSLGEQPKGNNNNNNNNDSNSNNNSNNKSNGNSADRKRTPERSRTPPRRSMEENTRPTDTNSIHGRPSQTGLSTSVNGKMQGAALSRSMDVNILKLGIKDLNRASSLNLAPRASTRTRDLKLTGGSINAENLSQLMITPGRLSVDSRRSDLDRRTRKGSRSEASNWSQDRDVGSFEDPSVDSDGASSTPRGSAMENTNNNNNNDKSKKITRGSYVPARFLQDTLSRIRRISDAGHTSISAKESRGGDNNLKATAHRDRANKSCSSSFGNGSSPSWGYNSPGRGPSTVMSLPVISSSSSSSINGGIRPKQSQLYSNLRGSQPSPTKTRGGMTSVNGSGSGSGGGRMSSMLSFGMELFKGKRSSVSSAVQEEATHQLRMLQNRWLQWRFVNARAEAAHETQMDTSQAQMHIQSFLSFHVLNWTQGSNAHPELIRLPCSKICGRIYTSHALKPTKAQVQNALYNVWAKTSQLRSSVVVKRIQLQKARHEEKVNNVLAAHKMLYIYIYIYCFFYSQAEQLEDWAILEKEHTSAVTGAMECLDAAIIRIPLVGGAKADVRSVKQVMAFAVDVMNGIQVAARKFLPQAEKVDSLLPELAETVTQERALLQECVELLEGVASLEVEERSLRTHLIQLQQTKALTVD